MLAGSTGLEPAASGVTGRRSNQLNYDPNGKLTLQISEGRFQIGLSVQSVFQSARLNLQFEISNLKSQDCWWAVQDSNL
jgi:hypothetical protein